MTGQTKDGKIALEAGCQAAEMLIPNLKMMAESYNDKERVLWWGGFMGVIGGSMASSIGGEASSVIREAISGMTGSVSKQRLS